MSAFKFRKSASIAFGILIGTAVVLGWVLFRTDEKSHEQYVALVGEANPGKLGKTNPYTAQQQRKGVQKDLFFNRNGQRLQLRLTSKEATMVLEHTLDGTQLIEKMQDVKCWMQEELLERQGQAYQTLRYLEADSATYFYKNDEVVASDVKVFRYTLPGHDLVIALAGQKPSMKGHADAVQFSMAGKEIQFKAQKLKATIEEGGL